MGEVLGGVGGVFISHIDGYDQDPVVPTKLRFGPRLLGITLCVLNTCVRGLSEALSPVTSSGERIECDEYHR